MPSPISPSAISNQQSAISFPADDAGWQMDARHVRWIHQVAMSGRFRHALEIGSYRGYSSVALLEAWAAGQLAELTLCEPEPPPELLALIAHYSQQRQPDTLHLDRRSSELVLADRGRQCDLVVLDGDHRDAVGQAEAALLLADPPRAIFAHDTSLGWPDFRGPALLKQALQQAGWHVLEDNLLRPGERTERGLTFAAPSLSTKFLAIASLTACGD